MDSTSIDFGQIIKRSWEVTLKYKWLWVLGGAIGIVSGGFSANSSSRISNSIPSSSSSPFPSSVANSGSAQSHQVADALSNLFKSVPPQSWILFVFGITAVVLFGVILNLIIVSWAKGGLIKGFEDANVDKPVDLKILSSYGIKSWRNLFIFKLISVGLTIGVVLSVFGLFGLGLLITPLLAIFAILGLIIFVVMMIVFGMVQIYAERLIVLKGYSSWAAWKKGLSLSKGNFLNTALMAIINSTIGCTAGCLTTLIIIAVLAIPAGILIVPIFSGGFHMPNIFQIIGIIILGIVFFTANLLVKAFFVVFNFGNWNQIFSKIYKE